MDDSIKSKSQLIAELQELRLLLKEKEKNYPGDKGLDTTNSHVESNKKKQKITNEISLRTALKYTKDCILIWDRNFNYLYANQAAADFVGIPLDQFAGKHISDILGDVPEYMELWKKRINSVIENNEVISFSEETELSGEKYFTDSVLSPVRDDSGQVEAVCAVYRDFTHRKNYEKKLKESESKFKYILENTRDMAYKLDLTSGTYEYLSPVSEVLMGFTPEELINMGFEEVEKRFHPEDRERYKDHFEKVLQRANLEENDIITTIEYRWKHKDGKYRWYSDNRHLIKNEKQTLASIVGSVRDITNRKESERQILELNQFLESIIDNANLWVNVLDANANVTIWNKAAEKMSGYSAEEVIGHGKIWEWGYPDEEYRTEINSRAVKIIEKGEVLENFETQFTCKDGHKIIISWHSRFLSDNKGNTIGSIAIGRDVTEQKRIQKALDEEQNFSMQVFKSMPGLFYIFEKDDLKFIQRNENWEKITGYTSKELDEINVLNLIYNKELCMQRINDVYENGYASMVNAVLTKSGEQLPYLFTGDRVKVNDKIYLAGLAIDISQRIDTEKALYASEKRFRSIVESSPLAMHFYNLTDTGELVFSGYNPAADKILGIDNSIFVGKTIEEAFPGLEETEIPRRYRDAAAIGKSWFTEQVNYEEGTISGAYELFVFQTEPQNMVVMFSEITERKQTEENLKASEAKFRSVIEQSNDAISIYYDGMFDLINKRFTEIIGLNKRDIVGKDFNLLEIIYPEDRILFKSHLKLWTNGKISSRMLEFRIVHKGGDIRIIQVSISLINYKKGKAILGFYRDMTDYKKLEDQLRHVQKIESIGHLAGGIAHDFNNLLTPIIGTSELRMLELNPDNPLYNDFREINETAFRASDLTRQLLAFSRKQVLQMKVVCINKAIENFRKILRRTIREDVKINVNYGDLKSKVKVDVSQIEQILLNLAVNAQDAMPGGGTITISTSAVQIDNDFAESHPGIIPGNYIKLEISDNGIGMDESVIDQIFDPFFTTKEVDKGTGLGLSTVYGIVKQHGGSIWANSKPGEGSTFSLYLPQAKEKIEDETEEPAVPENYSGTATILVVEDQAQVHDIAIKILRSFGHTVFSAKNGKEAIRKVNTEKLQVDLLLTDVVMPSMNGLELYEKLLKLNSKLKVIYMSGYPRDVISRMEDVDQKINFIQKPLTVAKLSAKLKSVLASDFD